MLHSEKRKGRSVGRIFALIGAGVWMAMRDFRIYGNLWVIPCQVPPLQGIARGGFVA